MISFTVPTLPARALSPNGAHGSFHEVAAARRALREATFAAIREKWASPPKFVRASITVGYYCTNKKPGDGLYRPTDVFNAISACKPLFDGIVDAGIIPDDDYTHLVLGSFEIVRTDSLELEGLVVVIQHEEAPPLAR